MSNKIVCSLDRLDVWCGYVLKDSEKTILTVLALEEFKKPISQRTKPSKLIELTRKLSVANK